MPGTQNSIHSLTANTAVPKSSQGFLQEVKKIKNLLEEVSEKNPDILTDVKNTIFIKPLQEGVPNKAISQKFAGITNILRIIARISSSSSFVNSLNDEQLDQFLKILLDGNIIDSSEYGKYSQAISKNRSRGTRVFDPVAFSQERLSKKINFNIGSGTDCTVSVPNENLQLFNRLPKHLMSINFDPGKGLEIKNLANTEIKVMGIKQSYDPENQSKSTETQRMVNLAPGASKVINVNSFKVFFAGTKISVDLLKRQAIVENNKGTKIFGLSYEAGSVIADRDIEVYEISDKVLYSDKDFHTFIDHRRAAEDDLKFAESLFLYPISGDDISEEDRTITCSEHINDAHSNLQDAAAYKVSAAKKYENYECILQSGGTNISREKHFCFALGRRGFGVKVYGAKNDIFIYQNGKSARVPNKGFALLKDGDCLFIDENLFYLVDGKKIIVNKLNKDKKEVELFVIQQDKDSHFDLSRINKKDFLRVVSKRTLSCVKDILVDPPISVVSNVFGLCKDIHKQNKSIIKVR